MECVIIFLVCLFFVSLIIILNVLENKRLRKIIEQNKKLQEENSCMWIDPL